MRMNIDEAGDDGFRMCVDGALGRRVAQRSDGSDSVSADRHVGPNRRVAGAIHDLAASNQQIVLRRLSR